MVKKVSAYLIEGGLTTRGTARVKVLFEDSGQMMSLVLSTSSPGTARACRFISKGNTILLVSGSKSFPGRREVMLDLDEASLKRYFETMWPEHEVWIEFAFSSAVTKAPLFWVWLEALPEGHRYG